MTNDVIVRQKHVSQVSFNYHYHHPF